MKKCFLLFICVVLLISSKVNAQHKKVVPVKSTYKLYANGHYHFSFEIPSGWKITSNGRMDYTCYAVSRIEKKRYQDYGYVFSLQVIPTNLDSAATSIFWHGDDGEYYYDPPMAHAKKVDRIKGKGFTGLHEIHCCRVSLDKNEPEQTTVVDGCEQFYLSDGKITLRFTTSGIALEKEDFNRLIQTMRF